MPHDEFPAPINPGEWIADPHACLGKHRAEHWYAPFRGSPVVQVLEYKAVRELLKADDALAAYDGGYVEDVMRRNPSLSEEHIAFMREATAYSLINMDGPEHDRLRALVARVFTPKSVEDMAPFIAGEAKRLAGELTTGADFMQVFARELPPIVLSHMLGIPEDDSVQFASWIDVLEVQTAPANLAKLDERGAADVMSVQLKYHGYIRELIATRRAAAVDDFVSRLVAAGEGIVTEDEMVQLVSDINFAANATARSALGNMVLALVSHPQVWEAVAAEPAYASRVVEEALRLHGPTPGPVRQACRTFEYRDHAFAEGDVAALSIWSANRDESFWGDDASAFDADREHAGEHLTFGHGSHFCLGAALARELLRGALIALTSRLTDLTLVEPPTMLPYGGVYGPVSMRLGFMVRG